VGFKPHFVVGSCVFYIEIFDILYTDLQFSNIPPSLQSSKPSTFQLGVYYPSCLSQPVTMRCTLCKVACRALRDIDVSCNRLPTQHEVCDIAITSAFMKYNMPRCFCEVLSSSCRVIALLVIFQTALQMKIRTSASPLDIFKKQNKLIYYAYCIDRPLNGELSSCRTRAVDARMRRWFQHLMRNAHTHRECGNNSYQQPLHLRIDDER
jgi:hypothetical protein